MSEESSVYEKPFRPTKSMTADELRKEVETWRNIWTWHTDEMQYWFTHVGYPVKIKMRNFTSVEGTLGQCHFDLKSIDINTTERIYNYARGMAVYETKTVTIPISNLLDVAMIHNKNEVKESYEGELKEDNSKVEHELE